jgi:hypothetical protein
MLRLRGIYIGELMVIITGLSLKEAISRWRG